MSVFDLDAFAAEADAQREPFRFRFGGEDYELPGHIDFRFGLALEQGDGIGALRRMLGDQWDRLVAAEATLTGPMARALIEKYLAHCGQTAGESSASSGSSASTARRSKRTSQRATALR